MSFANTSNGPTAESVSLNEESAPKSDALRRSIEKRIGEIVARLIPSAALFGVVDLNGLDTSGKYRCKIFLKPTLETAEREQILETFQNKIKDSNLLKYDQALTADSSNRKITIYPKKESETVKPKKIDPPKVTLDLSQVPRGIRILSSANFYAATKDGGTFITVIEGYLPPSKYDLFNKWRTKQEQSYPYPIVFRHSWYKSKIIAAVKKISADQTLIDRKDLLRLRNDLDTIMAGPETVKLSATTNGYKDFSDKIFFAVDSAGTAFPEDLISVKGNPKGEINVQVAIIDVSSVLEKCPALIRRALNYGETIYFPGKEVPLLGLNNLLEHGYFPRKQKRPALIVSFTVDLKGELKNQSFNYGLVTNRRNICYQEFDDRLIANQKRDVKRDTLSYHVKLAAEVAKRLGSRKYIFDKTGDGSFASEVVARIMIASKTVLFSELYRNNVPVVYRVHGGTQSPSNDLIQAIRNAGIECDRGAFQSAETIISLLSNLQSLNKFRLVKKIVETFIMFDRFASENVGHNGLKINPELAQAYGDFKPREAIGIVNQLQIKRFYSKANKLLTNGKLFEIAHARNELEESGNFRLYEALLLEELTRVLASTEPIYKATVTNVEEKGLNKNIIALNCQEMRNPVRVALKNGRTVQAGEEVDIQILSFNAKRVCWIAKLL